MRFLPLSLLFLYSCLAVHESNAQFAQSWLDVGEMHGRYSEIGAHNEGITANRGLEWPAILRGSGHYRAKSYWVGVKDWTNEFGEAFEYHTARIGIKPDGSSYFTPVETKLISKWEDTEVFVNGNPSFDKSAIVDEVDPDLPADRILYQKYRTNQGIETERWVYAYSNELHDDFHIVRRKMTNTGNTDEDEEIELNGQTLNDVLFYNAYRWVGREQAGWHATAAQVWGKFSMVDIVGDGKDTYPVDFTAIYSWAGLDPETNPGWDIIGSPMIAPNQRNTIPGDTIGRLAGMSMQGRIILHADESTQDRSYNPENQPITLGWIDSDESLSADGQPEHDYYELGILTRENPEIVQGGSSRMFPHYADRIEPTGEFWNSTNDASIGKQGGHAATVAYGPYQMAFGESINIVEAEAVAGLSYEAATQIGVAYKQSGFDDDLEIPFDANGDGAISETVWDYDVYKSGRELLTKNQWFFTERDSLYQAFFKARNVWEASNEMTQYPIVRPPYPPRTFSVEGFNEMIRLEWTVIPGSPDPVSWEIYRTNRYVDKLPYEIVAVLPGSARSYDDTDLILGENYFYFIQAVGPANTVDENGITGTPGGVPLRSGRYYTQTYTPVTLRGGVDVEETAGMPEKLSLSQNYPNPFIERTEISFEVSDASLVQIRVYNMLGQRLKTLTNRVYVPGRHSVEFDANGLSSGTYHYEIQVGDEREIKTMIKLP